MKKPDGGRLIAQGCLGAGLTQPVQGASLEAMQKVPGGGDTSCHDTPVLGDPPCPSPRLPAVSLTEGVLVLSAISSAPTPFPSGSCWGLRPQLLRDAFSHDPTQSSSGPPSPPCPRPALSHHPASSSWRLAEAHYNSFSLSPCLSVCLSLCWNVSRILICLSFPEPQVCHLASPGLSGSTRGTDGDWRETSMGAAQRRWGGGAPCKIWGH